MWLYNLGLTLYVWAIRLVAPRHPKARLWIEGRKDLFRRMREAIAPEDRVIWIHVASLGEFEQGRPIVEQLRRSHPEYKILITFFSPSGYEIRKNYPGADYIFYLPIDTPRNARRFLDAAHPEIAIFVKYEFWLNLLSELRRRKVRTYIVSAIFRRNSVFFRPYGGMWRRALESFDAMFVQNEESKKTARLARVRQCAGGRRHALRPRSGDRPGCQAGRYRGALQGRQPAVRGRIDLGARRGAAHPPDERQPRGEVPHRTARDGRGPHRTAYRRNPRRSPALHTMHSRNALRIETVAHPRHGRTAVFGLRVCHMELHRRRFRRGHPQHARGRDIRTARGIRPQLPEIQGGPRPGDARRRPIDRQLRRTERLVHAAARHKNVYPAFNYQQMIELHHTQAELKFLFLPYMAMNEEVIAALKLHPEVVIIAQSNHPNRLGEYRAMVHELMTEGLENPVVFFQYYQEEEAENLQIKAAADMGALIFDGFCDGIFIYNQGSLPHTVIDTTAFGILQAGRIRTSKTEYISCPGSRSHLI